MVNLLSTVTPSLSEQVAWLQEIFPFQVRADGYLLAAITGFILLTLETNLLRRKRVAWLLTISLLIVFIISNSLKGFDYEESLLAAVLLVQLLFMRGAFVAASDRHSIAQGVRVLIGALLFTLGLWHCWLFPTQSAIHSQLHPPRSSYSKPGDVFYSGQCRLEPTTQYGRFFANSIYLVGAATLLYALVMLLRPVLLRDPSDPTQRQQAKEIVEQYGRSSLANFHFRTTKPTISSLWDAVLLPMSSKDGALLR